MKNWKLYKAPWICPKSCQNLEKQQKRQFSYFKVDTPVNTLIANYEYTPSQGVKKAVLLQTSVTSDRGLKFLIKSHNFWDLHEIRYRFVPRLTHFRVVQAEKRGKNFGISMNFICYQNCNFPRCLGSGRVKGKQNQRRLLIQQPDNDLFSKVQAF